MADFRLRIMFAKEGEAIWLSHLELVRSMERCIRRSGLPYAVSQGFNPHLKHSFSAALPVGTGSSGEYMDVDLESLVSPKEALRCLQAVQHPNLPVLSVEYALKDAPSLQVDFNLATYHIVFDGSSAHSAPDLLERLKVCEDIEVAKKGKLKRYELALYVRDCSVIAPNHLEITLVSRPEGSLRPEVILAALAKPNLEIGIARLTRVALKRDEAKNHN